VKNKMVSNLRYFRADPNPSKQRGAGYYWHRGKGIFSKYEGDQDAKLFHTRPKGFNEMNAQSKIKMKEEQPHKHDYTTKSTMSKSERVLGVRTKNKRGYF
jgi:hypothetical protein